MNSELEAYEHVRKLNEEIAKMHPEDAEARRKVLAQPFIANRINRIVLILVALTLGVSIWALLHTYGLI